MKFFSALCCCLGLIAVASAAPKPGSKEIYEPLLTMCKGVEGGSDSDLATLLKSELPDSPSAYCMVQCVHEKSGIVSWNLSCTSLTRWIIFLSEKFKDGKLDKAILVEMGKLLTDNDEKRIPYIISMGETCEPPFQGKPRCDQGVIFQKCMKAEMAKAGIKVDLLF